MSRFQQQRRVSTNDRERRKTVVILLQPDIGSEADDRMKEQVAQIVAMYLRIKSIAPTDVPTMIFQLRWAGTPYLRRRDLRQNDSKRMLKPLKEPVKCQ
jgi:hypothetical protein